MLKSTFNSHRARPGPLACLLALLVGCGGDAGQPSPASTEFLAQASDFEGFRAWTTFDEPTSAADGVAHAGGRRIEHISALPPRGSSAFPVGTIIVKEVPGQPQLFAMVKRGGDYNSAGALGWEWFELADDGQGGEEVLWQGALAPDTQAYGGDPEACNSCHAGFASNDFVASSALSLASF